jgi:hypothetical protein
LHLGYNPVLEESAGSNWATTIGILGYRSGNKD